MTIRGKMLDEAKRLTEGERQESYRDPVDNFSQIAQIWSGLLEQRITAHQAAVMMAALKAVRLWHNPKHVDSAVDGAAYMAIAGECGQEQ